MNVPDEFFRVRLLVGRLLRALGGGGKRRLVMEAVEIAAYAFEFFDPFFRLQKKRGRLRHICQLFVLIFCSLICPLSPPLTPQR